MSTAGTTRRKNGSAGAVVTAPGQNLGCHVRAATAAGRGGGSATAHSLGCGVGLPPPPRSGGHGGAAATTTPVTTPFTIDGIKGRIPGSSASMEGFPFPPASSPPLYDAAGGDPSSPSW
jgi:hypothetical protein